MCNESINNNSLSYHPDCQTNPVLIYDDEVTDEKLKTMPVAAATMPCNLELKISSIPNAGRGVFAKYKIPQGWVFGPYRVQFFLHV